MRTVLAFMVTGLTGLTALAMLPACSTDTSLPIAAECNPLGANHCMTPWPNSAFEVDDSTTATGRKLAIPIGTLPTNADGSAADPSGWNTADGFSPAAPMVMAFPGGVSATGLPPNDDYGNRPSVPTARPSCST